MSEPIALHRGHVALLGVFKTTSETNATLRNGTVHFDGHAQDFLVGWYEDLKGKGLLQTEDWVGRTGAKLGERVSLTDAGVAALAKI